MTVRRMIMMSAALAVAGCDRPAPVDETAAANTAAPVPAIVNATEPAIASDAAVNAERYARCAVTMLTMSRIYSVLAESGAGAKRAGLTADAAKRKEVASLFYRMAVDNAVKSGHTEADVEELGSELQARYDRTRETRPFDEFAGQVADDADRCQELARTAT